VGAQFPFGHSRYVSRQPFALTLMVPFHVVPRSETAVYVCDTPAVTVVTTLPELDVHEDVGLWET